jgi:hypothetical protein
MQHIRWKIWKEEAAWKSYAYTYRNSVGLIIYLTITILDSI